MKIKISNNENIKRKLCGQFQRGKRKYAYYIRRKWDARSYLIKVCRS